MHLLNRLVGEKVELVLEHDTDLKPVRADKRQLEQVFMNLVVNARDAMPEGGRIHIKTEGYSLEQALDRDRATIPAGDYISVTVTDEGCGIATDKLTKIFEPFYSTKRTGEGTGLGLSTVYGIVKQTGGYIFVQSAEGQGTEFNLILPIFDGHRTEIAPVIEEPKIQPRTYGDGVILLVEDEAPVRTFASRALQLRGYKVIEAASAEEALDQLSDPNLQIDVFVTDIVMPGRDGPSWVKEALEQRPNTRVVFVSGYAEDVLETQQAAIPNSVFLPKPFSLDDLTETVQQQFN
jgi:two-component system cell cycle sensor histidine kinase/response regulator CckA